MAAKKKAPKKRTAKQKEQRAHLYSYCATFLNMAASIAKEAGLEEEFDRIAYAADSFARETPPSRPEAVPEEVAV